MTAPTVWGPSVWSLLHILSFDFKGDHVKFFHDLKYILPCAKCRHNYYDHIKMLPIPKTKKGLPRWLIRVHNRVNISTDKPFADEKEMLEFWKRKRAMLPMYAKEAKKYIGTEHESFWKTVDANLHHAL